MSEQPGPVAFVSLRSTTATGPYNGEKTLNLNCPAKADHLIRAIQKDLNILNRIISFLEKHIGRGRCGNGFTREDALKEREKFEKFKLESLVLKDQIDTMLFYHAKNKEKLSKEQLENLKKVEEIYFISTYENIPSDLINLK